MIKRSATVKIIGVRRRVIRASPGALRARPILRARSRTADTHRRRKLSWVAIVAIEQPPDFLITHGRIHTMRTVSGNLLVCKDSLFLDGQEQ